FCPLQCAASPVIGLMLVLGANSVVAEPSPRQLSPHEELFTYFYRDPRPERLVGFFDNFRRVQWDRYPPVSGLFHFVLRKNPSWIDRLIPAQLDQFTVEAIPAALRLAGEPAKAQGLSMKSKEVRADDTLKRELAGLPTRLEDLRITTPTHLDILW